MGEFVPGYEASAWYGVGAPKNTPAEIIDKLNKEINAGLADPKMKARLADLGGRCLPGSPADFGKLIADETEKWAKVIRAANIKAGVIAASRRHSINSVRRIAAPDSTPTTLEIRYRRAYRNRGHAYRPPSLSSILPPRHHAARTPRISRALTPSTTHGGHPRSRGAPVATTMASSVRCSRSISCSSSAMRDRALADSERLSASVRFRAVTGRPSRQLPRLGRLRVGKEILHGASLVGAAMCSACLRGSHDRWP